MVILVFGLAGAGKSTLARGLGERLGLRVIHASSLLRDLMDGRSVDLAHSRSNQGYWETPEGSARLEQRLQDEVPLDVVANRLLLEEIQRGRVIVDSWALPWLSPTGHKLALQVSLPLRAQRAALRAGLAVADVLPRIERKDEQTRQLFLRLYGFDLMQDWHVFHQVIEGDALSPEQMLEKALAGIPRGPSISAE